MAGVRLTKREHAKFHHTMIHSLLLAFKMYINSELEYFEEEMKEGDKE